MMTSEWDLGPAKGRCAVTGRTLQEGEEFYTVLFQEGEALRRADYSIDSWAGVPDGCFCHFKTRVPVKEKRKQLLADNETLLSFFTRLADQNEPLGVHFRFVLALILMRKRLLRYERSFSENGAEVWDMVLTTDRSEHRVVNPRLTDAQIEAVSSQLGAILHGDMGAWASSAADLATDPT